MTRVCVTGASGFIGSNLVARLKDQGHWVKAVDVKHTDHRRALYMQADRFDLADLRHFDQAARALAGAEIVYHLAADHGGAGYFYSDNDFQAAIDNLTIDRNILLAALPRTSRLFFASSACTYPTTIQHHHAPALAESELGQGEGEQLYGKAKRISTLLFEAARERGLDGRCGIFHTIYGPTQDYQEPRAKFPTAICRKLIENPDRVEVWGDGTQVRTFLYIDDALDRIQTVMNTDEYWGPVNIGSDQAVTVLECCKSLAQNIGANPEWVWRTDRPAGVPHRSSDNSEWDRRYGHTRLLSPQTGFARTYRWLRNELAMHTPLAA